MGNYLSTQYPGLPQLFTKAFKRLLDPALIPFYGVGALYTFLFSGPLENEGNRLLMAVAKTVPTLYLVYYISIERSPENNEEFDEAVEPPSIRLYFSTGLVLSSLGEALLRFNSMLIWGIVAFGAAHLLYIFGLLKRPRKSKTYVWVMFPLVLLAAPYITNEIGTYEAHYKINFYAIGDSYSLAVAVFVYSLIVLNTLFFALWGLETHQSIFSILAAAGAFTFILSDTLFAIDSWRESLPYSSVVVMATYYTAQLFIALSVARRYEQQLTGTTGGFFQDFFGNRNIPENENVNGNRNILENEDFRLTRNNTIRRERERSTRRIIPRVREQFPGPSVNNARERAEPTENRNTQRIRTQSASRRNTQENFRLASRESTESSISILSRESEQVVGALNNSEREETNGHQNAQEREEPAEHRNTSQESVRPTSSIIPENESVQQSQNPQLGSLEGLLQTCGAATQHLSLASSAPVIGQQPQQQPSRIKQRQRSRSLPDHQPQRQRNDVKIFKML